MDKKDLSADHLEWVIYKYKNGKRIYTKPAYECSKVDSSKVLFYDVCQ